jgi:resuscitation-promoting factor RpfA
VAGGESLWTIAAEHLPPGAPSARVDRAWRALYDANRPRLGDDPDLIRPGTVLRLPRPLA